jgi:hypothetical protein
MAPAFTILASMLAAVADEIVLVVEIAADGESTRISISIANWPCCGSLMVVTVSVLESAPVA